MVGSGDLTETEILGPHIGTPGPGSSDASESGTGGSGNGITGTGMCVDKNMVLKK